MAESKSAGQIKRELAKAKKMAKPAAKKPAKRIKWIHPSRLVGIELQRLMGAGLTHKQALPIALERKRIVLGNVRSPESDAFLDSYEWRRARMAALKLHGAKCQCCGATPKDGARMHVDHIKPRKLFPHLALELNNLQVLCHECNHGKGNWDMTDWREHDKKVET